MCSAGVLSAGHTCSQQPRWCATGTRIADELGSVMHQCVHGIQKSTGEGRLGRHLQCGGGHTEHLLTIEVSQNHRSPLDHVRDHPRALAAHLGTPIHGRPQNVHRSQDQERHQKNCIVDEQKKKRRNEEDNKYRKRIEEKAISAKRAKGKKKRRWRRARDTVSLTKPSSL